jgi:hypothetical protein
VWAPELVKVTRSKFYTEYPQILGVNVQNLVTQVTWVPGFLPPVVRKVIGVDCDNRKKTNTFSMGEIQTF